MKKYPKDTPVTLEMLLEIDSRPGPMAVKIHSMIEPPKPEPNDGEWWMCHTKGCHTKEQVLFFESRRFKRGKTSQNYYSEVTPLYKMVPEKDGK